MGIGGFVQKKAAGLILGHGNNKQKLADFVRGDISPKWMDFAGALGSITGNNTLVNLMTGIKGLQSFLFKTPKWPIGGWYFDGIMRTEHTRKSRATQHPVQTGANISDHIILEPAELMIEIYMSDAYAPPSISVGNAFVDTILSEVTKTELLDGQFAAGSGRSAQAWRVLKLMQDLRMPIEVETRLDYYENMVIEELTAPDDVKTLNALSATLIMKEIIMVDVSEIKVSARKDIAPETNGGTVQVQKINNDTALNKADDNLLGGFLKRAVNKYF